VVVVGVRPGADALESAEHGHADGAEDVIDRLVLDRVAGRLQRRDRPALVLLRIL
jgi:hypothetical protein